jgi:hypothetical protein
MVKEKLIFNTAAGYVEIPFNESLRPAITYSIADMKDPNKRKSDYSKTILLPSSKILDKTFNHIFEINIETASFNPNKRLEMIYLADDQIQLVGYLKLNEIIINDRTKIKYSVTIFGQSGDLFNKIGDKKLDELTGFATYNHNRDVPTIEATWSATKGVGYVYPIIDFGLNSDLLNRTNMDLLPAIYVKEYIDRIFVDAGKTYTSAFFTDIRFESLCIPFNGNQIYKTTSQVNNDIFKADTVTATVTTTPTKIIFTNEVQDAGGNYDPTTGVFSCGNAGFYDFYTNLDVRAVYTPSGHAVDVFLNQLVKVTVGIYVNGGLHSSTSIILGDTTVAIAPAGSYNTGTDVAYPSDAHGTKVNSVISPPSPAVWTVVDEKMTNPASNIPCSLNNLNMVLADEVEVRVSYSFVISQGSSYRDILANELFTDNAGTGYGGTVEVFVNSGKFINNITNNAVGDGGLVDMYSVIPKDVKQIDFLRSIINMFNLYIQPDNADPNNYIIEPYNVFYQTTGALDWQHKIDNLQDLTIEPMGQVEAGEYLYTYKSDKDYYNESYQSEYEEVYGQRSGLIDNDFLKNTLKNELIFSPTPIVGYDFIDMVIPTIRKNDVNNYQSTAHNIRILYYGGLKTTSTAWTLSNSIGTVSNIHTQYPYCGHFNDPYNPTFDINFGLPKKIYYNNTFSDITVTNNNLFNIYHLAGLQQIGSRDSKIVSGYFRLFPSDIANLSFRRNYFFKDAYFRLLKIENYDPNKPLTKCYFLKLLQTNPFGVTTGVANGGNGTLVTDFSDGVEITEDYPELSYPRVSDTNVYDEKSSVVGSGNYVDYRAKQVQINGDDNNVWGYVKNVNLINSNNNDVSGSNVTLINTNNLTVTEDNVTYIDNQSVINRNIVSITGEYIVQLQDGVIANLTGLNQKVFLPDAADFGLNNELIIKNGISGNTEISASSGDTIDGSSNITMNTAFQSLHLKSVSNNFWIVIN